MRAKFEIGQSLFEVVVAVAVGALIITAIVAVAVNSIQNSSYSRDKTLASSYVQETNEWLREQRDGDPSGFYVNIDPGAGDHTSWCFRSLGWTGINHKHNCSTSDYISGTKFIRQSDFSITTVDVPPYTKELISILTTVTWRDSKGNHSVASSTYLSTSP